jgi:hypothetical protein
MELTSSLSRLPTLMDNADDDEMSPEESKKFREEFRKRQEENKKNPLLQQQKELVKKFANFKRIFREKNPNEEIEAMAEYIIKQREFMDNLKKISELMKSSKK